ncbi:MAG: hypothetical protein ACYDCP_09915 [Thermoplasmataceae archaeon]
MGFSQATITSVSPPIFANGFATFSWASSAPAGTWFQVYVDLHLAWYGTTPRATVLVPAGQLQVDIGTVGPGEQTTDFSADIAGSNLFAELEWLGGTYESADLAGFHIYSGLVPGGAVNYGAPIATITAYPQGVITDGFGYGGFGQGGFGQAASTFAWTSSALPGGLWNFAVKSFDTAGNVSAPSTCSIAIEAPPLEPAAYSDGTRLHYTYSATTHEVTLNWNASPSA